MIDLELLQGSRGHCDMYCVICCCMCRPMIQADPIGSYSYLSAAALGRARAVLRVYRSCIVPGCMLSGIWFVLCCQRCCSLQDWGAKNAVLSANEIIYAPAAVTCLAAAWRLCWESCFVLFLLIALKRHLLSPPCRVLMCILPCSLVTVCTTIAILHWQARMFTVPWGCRQVLMCRPDC